VLRRGAKQITDRLPKGWTAKVIEQPDRPRVDGVIEITAPHQERAALILEAKRRVDGRDVSELKRRLSRHETAQTNSLGVVVAAYLSPPVRSRLVDAGLSFVDATGNLRVELVRPGLFLADRGADKDPWRGPGRPRGTLKGEPAARVVRALADFDRDWRMRELIEASGASSGAAYRVVEYLERAGLAERDDDGRVRVASWPQLLKAWSADYGLVANGRTTRWIASRGIPGLLSRMAQTRPPGRYAVTGTLAAAEWAAYAPAALAMVYVADAEAAARAWGLQPTDAGANVLLAEPPFDAVFERSWVNGAGVTIAAPSQVFVDLLTGPGRSPSEAEALLAWMQRNERAWRGHG
jgi:hypothetical protein